MVSYLNGKEFKKLFYLIANQYFNYLFSLKIQNRKALYTVEGLLQISFKFFLYACFKHKFYLPKFDDMLKTVKCVFETVGKVKFEENLKDKFDRSNIP